MINPTGGKERGCDKHGCGHFGASRGNRTHRGLDIRADVGQSVISPIGGNITKLGYPYGDDFSYRYIEITGGDLRVRIFYVKPTVRKGQKIEAGDQIGVAQELGTRYEGITEHIHLEVYDKEKLKDPKEYFT